MNISRTYELAPLPGQQKSFYGKAWVYIAPDGEQRLYSYDTLIMIIKPDGKMVRVWDGWSATTGRHIKAFCGLNKAEFTKLELEEKPIKLNKEGNPVCSLSEFITRG